MVIWVLDVTQGVRSFARQAGKVCDLDISTMLMLMSTISMSGRDCVAYGGRKDETFVALLTILGNASSMLRQLILQHFCHKNLHDPFVSKIYKYGNGIFVAKFCKHSFSESFCGNFAILPPPCKIKFPYFFFVPHKIYIFTSIPDIPSIPEL